MFAAVSSCLGRWCRLISVGVGSMHITVVPPYQSVLICGLWLFTAAGLRGLALACPDLLVDAPASV